MKAILLSLALGASLALGQSPCTSAICPTTTVPSGVCSANQGKLVGPSGTIYTCQSGTWAAVAGGGGGATIPATTNLISGNGAGNGADSGIAPSSLVTLNPTGPNIPTAGLSAEYVYSWPNYVKYSQTFSTSSYWTVTHSSVAAAGTCSVSCTAPDGTNTGSELVEAAFTGAHYIAPGSTSLAAPGASFSPGETFTLSLYGKANTRNWFALEVDDGSAFSISYFDFQACVTGNLTGGSGGTAYVVARSATTAANGWCRVAITYTVATSAQIIFDMASANGTISYAGNGTNSVLIWGAQVNSGSAVNTYASTTDLLTISDISGNANNGTITGTQSTATPNTSPVGLRLVPYASQSQYVTMPAALTGTMQTVIVVADVPPESTNAYIDKPFFGSSAALGPKMLVTSNCANGAGVNNAKANVRAAWWFGASGTPDTTACLAISQPQLPTGAQMVSVVMGAGTQDRVYVNGAEYGYYNSGNIPPTSSAGVSRAGLSAATPEIGADSSMGIYLAQVTSTVYPVNVYFTAVYNVQKTAEEIAQIYNNVKTWLAQTKGVSLGQSPFNTLTGNQLVFDGDSQTEGNFIPSSTYAAIIINGTYPTANTFTTQRILAISGGVAATISNRGQAGGLPSVYQPGSSQNVFVGMIGVNDVNSTSGCGQFTTTAACANYILGLNAKMFGAWKAAGFKTVALPMISGNPGPGNIVVNANLASVTTFIKHGMSTGASITVANSGNASLNGTYTVTVTSPTSFTFTTSGVSAGTYSAAATTITNVVMFDTIKDAFNVLLTQQQWPWADQIADTCSANNYLASANSGTAFSSLCTDGAARSNSQCGGVSCWQENSSATNLHPSAQGYLQMVQQVQAAINRTAPVSNASVTFTPGTNVTSATCISSSCNALGGSVEIVGGTATTGTIATVNYPALTVAPTSCTVSVDGGSTFFGVGHGTPTTTSFTITSAVTVSGATIDIDWICKQ